MDIEWWNSLHPSTQSHIVRLKQLVIEVYDTKGDSRIDGNANCPRCDSPYYRIRRMSTIGEGQPRSESPHYYGKHCYTCGFTFDPRKGDSK